MKPICIYLAQENDRLEADRDSARECVDREVQRCIEGNRPSKIELDLDECLKREKDQLERCVQKVLAESISPGCPDTVVDLVEEVLADFSRIMGCLTASERQAREIAENRRERIAELEGEAASLEDEVASRKENSAIVVRQAASITELQAGAEQLLALALRQRREIGELKQALQGGHP